MDGVTITTSILSLLAGVGVFLIACTMMSSNLESLGSKKLKALFAKASKSKLVGVGVGTVTTAAIQSSSATTVMIIGFVNAGVMSLTQAATVIFGANIGTTITGQIVALGMFGGNSVSTSVIFAAFAGIGAFILAFAKKDNLRKIGGIMAGFGMIFVGLSLMSGSMKTFAASDELKSFLAVIGNHFLLVLIGALLTAIIQSSSVMTSIAITMVVTGLISLNQGIYITMGSNIGTCVTALIAGITSSRNAKRTALIHVIFNISGVIVFMLIGLFLQIGGINFGWLFEEMFPNAPQTQLAMFHTVFNLVTVIIVLPLTDLLVKFVTKIIPDKRDRVSDDNKLHLYFIDDHMLTTPPIAVQQTKNEIVNMAKIALENFNLSYDIICTLDYSQIEKFRANENELNFLNKELANFIVKLLKAKLGEKDRIYLSTAIRSISDLERIGDYAENIVEYADKLKAADKHFSDDALKEIAYLKALIERLYDKVVKTYSDVDSSSLEEALSIENTIDDVTNKMAESHIMRLSKGVCTPDVGAQYLSLTSNTERIADHLINVAKTIKEYA
jgi:phosphate:Na+ symporter